MQFVDALNRVRSNVWSILLILIGVGLIMKGHDVAGNSLLTGSFAVFKSSRDDGPPSPAPTPAPLALPEPLVPVSK